MATLIQKQPTRNGKQLSLYIDPAIRDAGRALAKERYGESLSNLVERLLKAEFKRKRGVRGTTQ